MFSDTEAIRALAQRMRRLGEELRSEGDMALRAVSTVQWSGAAADALRFSVRSQVQALRRSAGLHDAAADALLLHAGEVDRRLGLLGAAEHAVGDLLSHLADAA